MRTPLKILYVLTFFSLFLGFDHHICHGQPSSRKATAIGTNLEGIRDYSGDWPFIDRMKSARNWITFDATETDKTWDTKIPFPADENGYPLEVPYDPDGSGPIPPQGLRTILFNSFPDYPTGEYTLIFEGRGKLHLRVDATCPDLPDEQCVFTEPNVPHRFLVKRATAGGIRLKIYESEKSDHIRNIRVIMPGFKTNDRDHLFHPLFLERLQGFSSMRFMDWASVNHSDVSKWSDRVRPDFFTFSLPGRGVPYEYMIALSNRLKSSPWFTVPTRADNDYVRELARLVNGSLDKDLGVSVEYSNEVWNTIFPQAKYVSRKGEELVSSLGLKVGRNEANAYYYARRSAEIFKIFEEEFRGTRRLTKVVSGQCMNPWVLRWIIKGLNDARISPTGVKADAIAIALYFGEASGDRLLTKHGRIDKKNLSVDDVQKLPVKAILDDAGINLVEDRIPKVKEHRQLADEYGLDLISYEGGQSLRVGRGFSADVVAAMTGKLVEANRNPEMKNLYLLMFELWDKAGGQDFMNFSYINQPNRWGMWGILEHQSQPIDTAYKYQAIREMIKHQHEKIRQ